MRPVLIKVIAFLVVTSFLGAMTWRLLSGEGTGPGETFRAEFTDVSDLSAGDDVRVAGVTVGSVEKVDLQPSHRVIVTFTANHDQTLTDQTRAQVKYKDLTGNRYLALTQGIAPLPDAQPVVATTTATGVGAAQGTPLPPDALIPVSRTASALDLDALFGGFQPLFNALRPEQVNKLSTGLVQILQGEGDNVLSVLRDIADFTATLSTRDAVIGQVITNLNTVLLSMTKDKDAFGDAVDSAQHLVSGLSSQRRQIAGGLQATGRLTGELTDTLRTLQPNLNETSDRLGTMSRLLTVPKTAQGISTRLTQLPDGQRALAGIGSYGAFGTFYFCGLQANYRVGSGFKDLAQLPMLTLPYTRCQ